jgi:rhodanese-related sulfurtransferase
MINNGSYPDLLILDVRNENYSSGYIQDSIWIPYWQFEEKIDELTSYKDQEILVYSHCGCEGGFSEKASEILAAHNFTKVYNMYGGIIAWQAAGYSFWIAGESYSIPIDTNSTITNFIYDPTTKQINLTINGPTGTTGTTQITLEKDVSKKLSVLIDDNPHAFTLVEEDDHNLLYLTYTHSVQEEIISISENIVTREFPYVIIGIPASAITIITIIYFSVMKKPSYKKSRYIR